jgi:hypothetical protein
MAFPESAVLVVDGLASGPGHRGLSISLSTRHSHPLMSLGCLPAAAAGPGGPRMAAECAGVAKGSAL